MSIINTLNRYAADYRARRRLRTYIEITNLPRDIQKDIGWPDALDNAPSARQGH